MCYSPLNITSKAVYKSNLYTPLNYNVPCGKCDGCRDLTQNEWHVRLVYELNDLYKRDGNAIFLTFTYNNENLPTWTIYNKTVSCFDRDKTQKFLKVLKTTIWRKYGKGSYKYFFCSEYGKFTKRPHYHGLFFLEKNVDYKDFAETCRRLWHFGFMFPKIKKGIYVDNNGNPSRILVDKLSSSASYVAKYTCKDLSFYNLPVISEFLEKNYRTKFICKDDGEINIDEYNRFIAKKREIANHLPKTWHSSNLGVCLLDNSLQNLIELSRNGIPDPSKPNKIYPFPSYLANKLLYVNKKSDRISKINGKPLYDRYLSAFGKEYLKDRYKFRVNKYVCKVEKMLSNSQFENYCSENDLDYKDIRNFLSLISLRWLAHVHFTYSSLSAQSYSFLNENYKISDILSDEFASDFYVKQKDLTFIQKNKFDELKYKEYYKIPMIELLKEFDVKLSKLFAYDEKIKSISRKIEFEKVQYLRRKFKDVFDKNLC